MITTILMRLAPSVPAVTSSSRLILPWQALYIHEGQSVVMQQYALDYDYGLLNNNDGASGYRDYNRVNWRGLSYGNGLALEHTDVHQR